MEDASKTSAEDGQVLELSIEETNKLRASLGLKPLALDGEAANKEGKPSYQDKERQAVSNLKQLRAEQARAEKRRQLAERIQKERAQASRHKKLEGTTLSEASPETDDALAWIQKQKQAISTAGSSKSQKLSKTIDYDEMDQLYSTKDLEGLRVAHNVDEFEEGRDTILVLKDSQIIGDEEEGDELLNVNMVEHKKAQENVENRKKRPGYTAYEEDDFSINNPGQKRDILSQYDDDILGPKKKSSGFRLSGSGVIAAPKQDKRSVSEKLKEKTVTLDFEKNNEISDYFTKEEVSVKIKKPKKKNKQKNNRSARKSLDDEGDEGFNIATPMEIDFSQSNKNKAFEDVNFVDDDDLQEAISRARRIASQKPNKPEEAVQALLKTEDSSESEDENTGLVISEATEFVKKITNAPLAVSTESGPSSAPSLVKKEPSDEALPVKIKEEEPAEEDHNVDIKMEDSDTVVKQEENDVPITEEPLVSKGLAATLALLSQKGLVQRAAPEEQALQHKIRERELWLIEERKNEKLRELEKEKERERNRALGRNSKLSGRDLERQREEEMRRLDRERLKLVEEKFKNYTPDVKIEYKDEFGRVLNTKEAYKQLAHKFHGTMPGKKKTDKRLKRIQDEMNLNKLSASVVSVAATENFAETAKSSGTAHLVLSVGNRAVALPEVTAKPSSSETHGDYVAPQPVIVDTREMVNMEEKREKIAFGFGLKRKAEDNPVSNARKRAKDL